MFIRLARHLNRLSSNSGQWLADIRERCASINDPEISAQGRSKGPRRNGLLAVEQRMLFDGAAADSAETTSIGRSRIARYRNSARDCLHQRSDQ